MTGLRPNRSLSWRRSARRRLVEQVDRNSQGNCAKPPRSSTMAGTAVARMVESMATRPTLSITDSRIGRASTAGRRQPGCRARLGSAMTTQPSAEAMHSRGRRPGAVAGPPPRHPSAR
jgi:hypothetical protein